MLYGFPIFYVVFSMFCLVFPIIVSIIVIIMGIMVIIMVIIIVIIMKKPTYENHKNKIGKHRKATIMKQTT